MICYACQSKMEDGRAKCPVCGFPVIQSVEGNTVEIQGIRQMAKDYIRQWLGGVVIGIASYSYVMEDNKLKQDKIADLDLAQADQLVVGEPLWSDVDFAKVDDRGMVTIHAFMKRDGIRYAYELQAKLPETAGSCHVGVMLMEGLKAQLVLGNPESHTISQPFSLVVYHG